MPIYGRRTVVRKLASGRLPVTYRNRWGTHASCVFVGVKRSDCVCNLLPVNELRTGNGGFEPTTSGSGGQRSIQLS